MTRRPLDLAAIDRLLGVSSRRPARSASPNAAGFKAIGHWPKGRPIFLDLFAGLCGASEPFVEAGWEVVRLELDPCLLRRAAHVAGPHDGGGFVHDVVGDARTWSWVAWSNRIPHLRGRRPTIVWSSPPCNEFSREDMPWCRTGIPPSTELVRAALRIIREAQPRWWMLENVKGATKHLDPILGRWKQHHGAVFLWGDFPRFDPGPIAPWKERLSSSRKAERAKIPRAISDALLMAAMAVLESDL